MNRSHATPIFDRTLSWALDRSPTATQRYLVATVAILTVAIVRATLITGLLPWLLFIPAVLMIALMLGSGAGNYATMLAALFAAASIGHSDAPLWLSRSQWVASTLFVAIGFGMVALAAELRAAFRRMRALVAEQEATLATLARREAFLSSVLASSTDCIKVLDLEGRLTFMTEGGMKVMDVTDFNAIRGCPWPGFWEAKGAADAQAAILAATEGQSANFIGRAATMAGTMKWWDVAVSPIVAADGRTGQILAVSRDITASRRTEEDRARLVRIVETSADFIGMARLDGSVFFLNDAGCELVGLAREDVEGVAISDFFAPDEAQALRDIVLPEVDRSGGWSGERIFRHFGTGELIPVLYTVFPVRDLDGSLFGYGTVTRDFRERKRAEAHQRLLNNELSHRLKNVLSIVQAVASQSLRQADDLASANIALGSRLVALGEASDVLTATQWSTADLAELARRALAPHCPMERFRIAGPVVQLTSRVALAMALALHELATNAVKYGALSNDEGHVELAWRIDPPAGADARLLLVWQEIGGPEVQAPTRRGFGSQMIERSLQAYVRGTAVMTFEADGLRFSLDALLVEVSGGGES